MRMLCPPAAATSSATRPSRSAEICSVAIGRSNAEPPVRMSAGPSTAGRSPVQQRNGGVVATSPASKALQVILPKAEARQVERYAKRKGLSVSGLFKTLLKLLDLTK